MISMQTTTLFIFLILITKQCTDHCLQCDPFQFICLKCHQGYKFDDQLEQCINNQQHFSYKEQIKWPGICSTGTKQSPINIITKTSIICPKQKQLSRAISHKKIPINPSGQNLQNQFLDLLNIKFTNKGKSNQFQSIQFHWHSPSQHQINGQRFDLQFHIVHESKQNHKNLAVLSLLFRINDTIKEDIFDRNNFFMGGQDRPFVFPFDINNKMVYYYEGSLTTPPCSETVNWFVLTDYFLISTKNLNHLSKQINEGNENSRNVQQINERKIMLIGNMCG